MDRPNVRNLLVQMDNGPMDRLCYVNLERPNGRQSNGPPSKITVVDRNFGRSKITVGDGNSRLSKITVWDRNFGPSKITVGDHNFRLSKTTVWDRNFEPSKKNMTKLIHHMFGGVFK